MKKVIYSMYINIGFYILEYFVGYYRFNTTSNIVEIANINNENQK